MSAFTKAEGAQKATEATVSPGCPSCCCQYFVCFFKLFCDEDEVGSSSTCININTSIRTLEALGWSLAPNVCLCLLAWCSHLVGQRRGSKGRRVISHGPRLLPRHSACRRRHGRVVLNANPLRERTGLNDPVFGATFLLSVRTEATCARRLAVLLCIHTFVYRAVVPTHGLVAGEINT